MRVGEDQHLRRAVQLRKDKRVGVYLVCSVDGKHETAKAERYKKIAE